MDLTRGPDCSVRMDGDNDRRFRQQARLNLWSRGFLPRTSKMLERGDMIPGTAYVPYLILTRRPDGWDV